MWTAGRDRVIHATPGSSLFPNWLVLPHRTRDRGRIGIAFGCGLPSQARELTTSSCLEDPLGLESPRPLVVEDVEGRQANIEDFVFTKHNFMAYSGLARYHIQCWRCCPQLLRSPASATTRRLLKLVYLYSDAFFLMLASRSWYLQAFVERLCAAGRHRANWAGAGLNQLRRFARASDR
jgi:hypothetical protein